jgi:hypothetical protein
MLTHRKRATRNPCAIATSFSRSSRQSSGLFVERQCSILCNRHAPSSKGSPSRSQHVRSSPTAMSVGSDIACAAHLNWCSAIISGGVTDILQNIRHVRVFHTGCFSSIRPLACKVLDRLDILVLLLAPCSGNIAETHLLTLVNEKGTGERSVEHCKQFSALGSVFWVVRSNTRNNSRLVMVLQAGSSTGH